MALPQPVLYFHLTHSGPSWHLYKFWNPWTVAGARTERKIPALELKSKELPGKTHGKLPVSEAFAIDKEMAQASLQGILP